MYNNKYDIRFNPFLLFVNKQIVGSKKLLNNDYITNVLLYKIKNRNFKFGHESLDTNLETPCTYA